MSYTAFRKYAMSVKQRELLECARRYGTPLYVLDEEELKRQARSFTAAFKNRLKKARFFYAFKSNDLPHMIGILKEEGFGADVASGLELKLAIKLGFSDIIYTAPVKSADEIRLAAGAAVINVDNMDELLKIPSGARVSLRIRSKWPKFGFALSELPSALSLAKKQGLQLCGLHFHSSWNKTPRAFVRNISLLAGFLWKRSIRPGFVSVGGGFLPEGSGYEAEGRLRAARPPQIGEYAEAIADAAGKLPGCEVWLEPGRYISSIPTSILLRAVSVRKQGVYVDGGINLMGGAGFTFEAFPVVNLSRPSAEVQNQRIYGPLCDPDDHWGRHYYGHRAQKGDILAVLHQGAYTFSTAWRWQQPTAAYAAFGTSGTLLARRRETFADRYRGTKPPIL